MITLTETRPGEWTSPLPDARHRIVVWRSADKVLCRVVRTYDGSEVLKFAFNQVGEIADDLITGFCEKAEKRFQKPLRYKGSR